MPVSAYQPDVVVEIAFDSGYLTPAASRTWTDVSAYVEAQSIVSIVRGRQDQWSAPQPSRLSLTLDNRDGRFTPENAAGAYYPNVKKGRPIRVRAKPVGAGAYVDRFVGYIDEWPVEWPGDTDAMSTVTISATSRQARLGRTAEFKSIVEAEVLYDSPVLYFPLGEPSGSTTAGNIAPGRSEVLAVTPSLAGGSLVFGGGIGPGTDDLGAPLFTSGGAPSTNQGFWLRAALDSPVTQPGDHVVALEAWFTGVAPPSFTTTLAALTVGPTDRSADGLSRFPQLIIEMDSAGGVFARFNYGTTGGASRGAGSGLNDGLLHHVVAFLEISDAGTHKIKTVCDGVDLGYSSSPAWPFMTAGGVAYFPTFSHLNVGGQAFSTALTTAVDLWTGTIAHVALYRAAAAPLGTVARFIEHYNAGADGFTAEGSGARIARYARLAGIPTAEVSTAAGLSTSIAHKDTTGKQPISLMQDVAETEDGVVFDGKDGTLTFHSRSHRYGAASAFTLSVAAGDVEGGIRPTLDDQHLTNDVTASRPNGVTIRSTNDASITEYGYYKDTVEILTTSDNEVQSRADWEVNRFGTPRVTIPNLGVDLVTCSSGLITSLIAADIGTKFTVTGLPSQAPSSTMTFFIEGITERIGAETYRIEFNVSPAAYANVWTLDSASLSQLDSTTVLAY